MNPFIIKAGALVLVASLLFGMGWRVHAWKTDAEMAQKIAQMKREHALKLSEREKTIKDTSIKLKGLRGDFRRLQNATRNTDLGTCNLSNGALQLLDDAARPDKGAEASESDDSL